MVVSPKRSVLAALAVLLSGLCGIAAAVASDRMAVSKEMALDSRSAGQDAELRRSELARAEQKAIEAEGSAENVKDSGDPQMPR